MEAESRFKYKTKIEVTEVDQLSDTELMLTLQKTVSEERRITAEVISLLKEVDCRKLYLSLGYGSLIEFCLKELKYSESSAYRRLSAMRIVRELPHIQEKVLDGTLSLSVISQAQTQIRREEKEFGRISLENKARLVQELENKSSREAEMILLARTPGLLPKERVSAITADQSEVRVTLSDSTLTKLEQIKLLISHKNPNATYAELIELMADVTLQKLDPTRKALESARSKRPATPTRSSSLNIKTQDEHSSDGIAQVATNKAVPASIRRQVWQFAKGQCSYEGTKGRCNSRFQLQVDHKIPRCKGGTNSISNLQLLCSQHNRWKGFG